MYAKDTDTSHKTATRRAASLNQKDTQGFSRRRFLERSCASLIIPMVGLAARPQIAQATPDPITLIARTDVSNRLAIEVYINDKGPFRFVVDTGAERSVFSESIARQIELQPGHPVQVAGLASTIIAQTALVSTLKFGPFTRRQLEIPLLPDTFLGCDGYLGLDVIKEASVTFDFTRHKLHIEYGNYDNPVNGRVYSRDTSSTQVRLSGGHGRLRATDCKVDGVRTQAFIDTGAEVSIGNLSLLSALKRNKVKPQDFGPTVLVGVTGGRAIGQLISIGHIQIQGLQFSDGAIAIADVQNFAAWGLDQTPAILMGMDYLRQFGSVSIDYRARQANFELSLMDRLADPKMIARTRSKSSLG